MLPGMVRYTRKDIRFDTPDRFIWLYGSGWIVKVELYAGHHWNAVELDEFGGFRRRLYDGREVA